MPGNTAGPAQPPQPRSRPVAPEIHRNPPAAICTPQHRLGHRGVAGAEINLPCHVFPISSGFQLKYRRVRGCPARRGRFSRPTAAPTWAFPGPAGAASPDSPGKGTGEARAAQTPLPGTAGSALGSSCLEQGGLTWTISGEMPPESPPSRAFSAQLQSRAAPQSHLQPCWEGTGCARRSPQPLPAAATEGQLRLWLSPEPGKGPNPGQGGHRHLTQGSETVAVAGRG